MPGMYVTKEACFGWEYQSRDPWFEPYQVNGTQGSLFYEQWTQIDGFSFGGWVPNSSLISFSTIGQAENYLKIANGGEAEYTFNVSNGYDRAYAQFKGFDQHFFDYEFATGKFYLPEVDVEINPIKVLLGIIDWYSPTPFLDDLYSSLPPYINTTPNDPPLIVDNTFESLIIPLPPIFKTIKGARAAKRASFFKLEKSAKLKYPKLATQIHKHHITPKYLGGAKNGPLVPLNAAYHQMITNEFRALWDYGIDVPSATELQRIMKKVYETFPLPPGY